MTFEGLVLAALAVLAAALTGVCGVIVTRRLVCTVVQRHRAALTTPWRGPLLAAAAGEELAPQLLTPLDRAQWGAVEAEVLRLARLVRGEGRDRLVEVLARHGRISRARHRITGRGPVRRARAAELLGLAGDERSLPALARLLADHDREVRLVAVRAIGRIGAPAAVGILVAALARHDVPARVVAQALVHLRPGADGALDAAARHHDPVVRAYLMEVLGLRRAHPSSGTIVRALRQDPEAEVRLRAAKALSRLAMPATTPALRLAVRDDPDPGVRAFAARALGEIRDPRAVAALESLLRARPTPLAARNAAHALACQGGGGLWALRSVAYGDDETAAAHAVEALSLAALEVQQRGGSRPGPAVGFRPVMVGVH